MSKKKAINFDLSEIADGGVQVKLNRALQQVADNILDPNTDPTKKRKIQLNISISPNEKRDASDVTVEVKTTLAPEVGVPTTMLLGRDINGKVHVNELKSGVKGQTYIDPVMVKLRRILVNQLKKSKKKKSARLLICKRRRTNLWKLRLTVN